jgi:prepilin-type N-terminal cleavage/methylation domain-containing protein
MRKRIKRFSGTKPGFTLIEIAMVALLMAGLMTAVYQMYSAVSKTQTIGQWMLETTTQLRNGLSLIREEIAQASKPQKVTQMGAEELFGGAWDSWKELICPTGSAAAGGKTFTDFTQNKTLLAVYSSNPGREGIPGVANEATTVTEVTVKIDQKQLVMEKRKVVPMGVVTRRQVICAHPTSITFRLIKIPVGTTLSVKNRHSIDIEVHATHPRYTTTNVTESINGPFEVEPKEQY